MEFKTWQGEIKAVSDGNGGFEGYASLFGIRDEGGDVVEAGAFTDTIPQFVLNGFISDGHNWESVGDGAIGTVVDAKEDARGLFIKTEYHSTPAAQAARVVAQERIARGKSVGLSIGYAVAPGGAMAGEDGTRRLSRLDLFEVGQVNVPMLRQAGITAVKGFGIPFEDHSDNVRVAVEEWLERARSGSDVRLKEGRPISEARRIRMAATKVSLAQAVAEIEALLLETEPRTKEDEPPKALSALDELVRAEFARFQAQQSLYQDLLPSS